MFSGRKDCTTGAAKCQPVNEREALYCVGTHSQKTRTQIAEEIGISPATLGAWIDPHGDERMPDVRRDDLLSLAKDNDAWLKFHAKRLGFVVYDPHAAHGSNAARMVSEFGDVLRKMDEVLADGSVSAEEAREFADEANDMHAALDRTVREIQIKAAALPLPSPLTRLK